MLKNKLAIIGAGELGMQIAHHAHIEKKYDVVGYFDTIIKETPNGIPVLGGMSDVSSLYNEGVYDFLFIAIGYKHLREKRLLFEQYSERIPFATIISPFSYVDESAVIGIGSIIYPGTCIDKNAIVGNNVLINLSVTVSHNSIIGNHSFIAPSVSIAGFTVIEESCFLGIGCTIIDNLKIANNSTIGAGAVVVSDIRRSGIYAGVPSKIRKTNDTI